MQVNILRATLTKISRGLEYYYRGINTGIMRNGYEVEFDGQRLRVRGYESATSDHTEWKWIEDADLEMVASCLRFIPEIKEKLRIDRGRYDALAEDIMVEARDILNSLGEISDEE